MPATCSKERMGKRVTIIAGKGNNGADGIEAAKCLQRWGVKVNIIQGDDDEMKVHGCDLLIDAAVGTGLKRPYCAPHYSGPCSFGRYSKWYLWSDRRRPRQAFCSKFNNYFPSS